MVGAQLHDGASLSRAQEKSFDALLGRTKHAPWYLRGFAALSLGLAARDASTEEEPGAQFRRDAGRLLGQMAYDGKAQWAVRGAAVVGLGLLGDEEGARCSWPCSSDGPRIPSCVRMPPWPRSAPKPGPDVIQALERAALNEDAELLRTEGGARPSLCWATRTSPASCWRVWIRTRPRGV